MSINEMRGAWPGFRAEIKAFYAEADFYLERREPMPGDRLEELDPVLEKALAASAEIRHAGTRALETRDESEREPVETLMLAVAAVDAMLASDLANLDEGYAAQRSAEELEGWDELAEDRAATLGEVDDLFGEATAAGLGGEIAGDRAELVVAVGEITDELVELAAGPTPRLLKGLAVAMTGGGAEILIAAEHVDVLADLKGGAAAVVSRAPEFLREHVAKMLALHVGGKVVAEVVEAIRQRIGVEAMLVRIAAVEEASDLVEGDILGAANLEVADAEAIKDAVTALVPGYRKQMKVMKKSAKWLRIGASPLTHLVAPFVGHAAICGVFLIGLGYVAYSLTDRIDARDLEFFDFVEGVVPLVAARV